MQSVHLIPFVWAVRVPRVPPLFAALLPVVLRLLRSDLDLVKLARQAVQVELHPQVKHLPLLALALHPRGLPVGDLHIEAVDSSAHRQLGRIGFVASVLSY